MLCTSDLSVDPCAFWSFWFYLACVALALQAEDVFSQQDRNLAIILLTLEPSLVNELHQPLNYGEDVVYIQTLKLKGLQCVGALHVNQSLTDMLWDFYFLSDLHLIVVVDFDLEVGTSYTPGDASDDFVKGLQRGNPDPKVACEQQNLINLVEPGIVLRRVVDNFCHWTFRSFKILE